MFPHQVPLGTMSPPTLNICVEFTCVKTKLHYSHAEDIIVCTVGLSVFYYRLPIGQPYPSSDGCMARIAMSVC